MNTALAGLIAVALLLLGGALPISAQDQSQPQSAILTIDRTLLFNETQYGQRILSELNVDAAALVAENQTIDSQLQKEEQDLTARRAVMVPSEFREAAAAFDAKVVELRSQQDQKLADLTLRREAAPQEFENAILPVLVELVRERGAVAMLDRRTVLISDDAIDVTSEAIRRINETLGDGRQSGEPSENSP